MAIILLVPESFTLENGIPASCKRFSGRCDVWEVFDYLFFPEIPAWIPFLKKKGKSWTMAGCYKRRHLFKENFNC